MADHMVISAGCFSQIKYIYIEDLCSSQISLLGGGGLWSDLEVCVCLVPPSSCSDPLIIHLSRGGDREGNRMQKGQRNTRELSLLGAGQRWGGGGLRGAGRASQGEELEDAESLPRGSGPSGRCLRAAGTRQELARWVQTVQIKAGGVQMGVQAVGAGWAPLGAALSAPQRRGAAAPLGAQHPSP